MNKTGALIFIQLSFLSFLSSYPLDFTPFFSCLFFRLPLHYLFIVSPIFFIIFLFISPIFVPSFFVVHGYTSYFLYTNKLVYMLFLQNKRLKTSFFAKIRLRIALLQPYKQKMRQVLFRGSCFHISLKELTRFLFCGKASI